MKKTIFLSIALVLVFTMTKAQTIPNFSFENWTSYGNYENPDQWGTMNNTTASSGIFTATQGVPGAEGYFGLKLVSKTVGSSIVNGVAVSGVLDSITLEPISGFAFSSRPASLGGKWQHMIYGSSQGSIKVTLTRWDTNLGERVQVASGIKNLSGMAMSWANFSIPLTYTDGNNPDTCIIIMKASGIYPADNDYLFVDNLAFTGEVSGLKEISQELLNLNIYPNPASDYINLNFQSPKGENYSVELRDVLGKTIKTQTINTQEEEVSTRMDINNIPQGIYFITLRTNTNTITKKITIK
ncbi:MAG: hypothetical protein H6Q15_1258 [Bacteroidetes bacterium]|nr:hypothetical protein [Bacteroidota bacterium]